MPDLPFSLEDLTVGAEEDKNIKVGPSDGHAPGGPMDDLTVDTVD